MGDPARVLFSRVPFVPILLSESLEQANIGQDSRELKQPWWRRQQKPHKFPYLTMKNSIFARFARAFFIFWHFEDVLVLSTWNDLFCSCEDDVSIWQMFNFVLLCRKRSFQFNSRIVRTNFRAWWASLDNWKMIAETRSHVFRWRSRFRRRRVRLSSLVACVIVYVTLLQTRISTHGANGEPRLNLMKQWNSPFLRVTWHFFFFYAMWVRVKKLALNTW